MPPASCPPGPTAPDLLETPLDDRAVCLDLPSDIAKLLPGIPDSDPVAAAYALSMESNKPPVE